MEAKILVSIVYQRQQDTLIVWSDPNRRDLALSFQEKAGCDEIWEKICEVLGEDSSQEITSQRSSSSSSLSSAHQQGGGDGGGGLEGGGGGGIGGGGGGGGESDNEEPIESDINMSPSTDLPSCELAKLKVYLTSHSQFFFKIFLIDNFK